MTGPPDPGAGGDPGVRSHFSAELDQLRLQVEVMAVQVSVALDRMGRVPSRTPEGPLLMSDAPMFRTLGSMAEVAQSLYREGRGAAPLAYLAAEVR